MRCCFFHAYFLLRFVRMIYIPFVLCVYPGIHYNWWKYVLVYTLDLCCSIYRTFDLARIFECAAARLRVAHRSSRKDAGASLGRSKWQGG